MVEKSAVAEASFEERLSLAAKAAAEERISGSVSGNATITFKPKKKSRVSKK
jgi:hypothetical protein